MENLLSAPVLHSGGQVPPPLPRELNSHFDEPNDPSMAIFKLSDVQKKVRELELKLIDSKAQLDRKFAATKESLSSKVERDIKTMEGR